MKINLVAILTMMLFSAEKPTCSDAVKMQVPKVGYASFVESYLMLGIGQSQVCHKYTYAVNGVNYYHCENSPFTEIPGQKCIVLYDSLNPSISIIYTEKRIFLASEKTKPVVGIIVDRNRPRKGGYSFLGYNYYVSGKKYYSNWDLMDSSVTKLLSVGDSVGVVYGIDNPKRSILLVDTWDALHKQLRKNGY